MERKFLLLSHLQRDGPHDHYIIFVLGQDEKYMVKNTLCMKEFPRAKPEGTLEGQGVYSTVYPESSPYTDSILW